MAMRRTRLFDIDGARRRGILLDRRQPLSLGSRRHRVGMDGNAELFAGRGRTERLVVDADEPLAFDQPAEGAVQQRILAQFDGRLQMLLFQHLLPG